ncbi:MAG: thrombospondin type-1 domain-containing protein, partial [Chitinophagales bacterium]
MKARYFSISNYVDSSAKLSVIDLSRFLKKVFLLVLIINLIISGQTKAATLVVSNTNSTGAGSFIGQVACDNTWQTGSYSSCSVKCGGGVQARQVQCVDCDGNVVSDAECNDPKPAETQACNTEPCCENSWLTGAFSECSEQCGGGVQTRQVQCVDCDGNVVSDAECNDPK